MYELLCRSAERPWAAKPQKLDSVPNAGNPKPLVLHMQENRSHLSQHERITVTAIAVLVMLTSLLSAAKGFWLTAAFMLLAVGALVLALERHGKSVPAHETLELADGRVRHRDSSGRLVELPAFWLRLAAEGRSPSELRLFLRGRDGSIEFGRYLSLDERRAIMPIVASALAQARGC